MLRAQSGLLLNIRSCGLIDPFLTTDAAVGATFHGLKVLVGEHVDGTQYIDLAPAAPNLTP
jgi:hypothetical protein